MPAKPCPKSGYLPVLCTALDKLYYTCDDGCPYSGDDVPSDLCWRSTGTYWYKENAAQEWNCMMRTMRCKPKKD